MLRAFLLSSFVFLSGCAAAIEEQKQLESQFQQSIPVCNNEKDCKAKWEAAQLWIVKNSGLKLQNTTSVLLETYNPPQHSPTLAARVIKEPLGGGKYKIIISTFCNNFIGCTPDARQAALDFNRTISAVKP